MSKRYQHPTDGRDIHVEYDVRRNGDVDLAYAYEDNGQPVDLSEKVEAKGEKIVSLETYFQDLLDRDAGQLFDDEMASIGEARGEFRRAS